MTGQREDVWDVVVVGGGPPGENAALYAIQGSDRTAVIVERELVGGECSYWACMPSKALIRPIEVLDTARAMPGLHRAAASGLEVDAVLRRRDAFTSHHDDGSQVGWANGAGIDVVRGHGRLAGDRLVEVTAADGSTRTLRARHAVVLATGTTPALPPVPGLAEALPWTSRDVTNLHEVPERMAVIGGGVVACEAAYWLRGLGVRELTLITRGPLLGRSEPFAGELVGAHLTDLGVRVVRGRVNTVSRPDAAATGEGRVHGGPASLDLTGEPLDPAPSGPDAPQLGRVGTLVVDEIVVATGRTPATSDLGLHTVGLDAAVGYLKTDDHLAVTGVEGGWLYAVGDVNGRALLTHMGKYQARICGAVIAARAEGRPVDGPRYRDLADRGRVPQVVFTDPQVASVGPTEAAARSAGIDVEVVEYDLSAVAGAALLRDGYLGRAKLVIDRATDTLVGATFVGHEVAELVHAATVAVVGKVPMETLWHAVPSYPTLSEIWLRLLEARAGTA